MITATGFNFNTLRELAGWEAPVLLSVFVPIDFSQPQGADSVIRALRLAAKDASTRLTNEHAVSPDDTAAFVAPLLDEMLVDHLPRTARGLAIFLSPERVVQLVLPIEVGPAVEIGDRADLLRLLPAIIDDQVYFTLTIGKKGAQLFRGSRFEFHPVAVPEMPGSIDDALWYIRRESVMVRNGAGALHGAGGGEDLRKDDVRQYIHLIDRAITPVLNGAEAPLVVVGVEYEAAMFINQTHYRNTADAAIAGSPEAMSADELHRRSWELVQSLPPASTGALERLRELVGTGKTATDPDEVVAAGRAGSVAELLVVRSETHVGETSPAPAADRTAVVAAVNDGLRHRARIHLVGDETLPAGARFAAVLRY